MASQITNYKCPACTGPLHFVGASGKLECDSCGAQYEVADIEKLLAILHTLDDPNTSGYLWLRAYEHHYSEEIFSALLNKHAQETPALSTHPAAQLIFCMDDREESVRRHLEELAPQLETLGAAGVFEVL